jgi:hypothetical protein
MNERIISWTPANWITVVLMVGLGFAIIGFLTRLYQQKKGKTATQ